MKKIISLIVTLLLIVGMFGTAAYADAGARRMAVKTVRSYVPDKTIDAPDVYGRKIIWSFLEKEMNLNRAAIAGVLANMRAESMLRTDAIGDYGTSYGLCQWHEVRCDRLEAFADSMNLPMNNIDVQLQYFKQEMESQYPMLLDTLRNVEDSEIGAYTAAYELCVKFERPLLLEESGESRGCSAKLEYKIEENVKDYELGVFKSNYMKGMSMNIPPSLDSSWFSSWTSPSYKPFSETVQYAEPARPLEVLSSLISNEEKDKDKTEQDAIKEAEENAEGTEEAANTTQTENLEQQENGFVEQPEQELNKQAESMGSGSEPDTDEQAQQSHEQDNEQLSEHIPANENLPSSDNTSDEDIQNEGRPEDGAQTSEIEEQPMEGGNESPEQQDNGEEPSEQKAPDETEEDKPDESEQNADGKDSAEQEQPVPDPDSEQEQEKDKPADTNDDSTPAEDNGQADATTEAGKNESTGTGESETQDSESEPTDGPDVIKDEEPVDGESEGTEPNAGSEDAPEQEQKNEKPLTDLELLALLLQQQGEEPEEEPETPAEMPKEVPETAQTEEQDQPQQAGPAEKGNNPEKEKPVQTDTTQNSQTGSGTAKVFEVTFSNIDGSLIEKQMLPEGKLPIPPVHTSTGELIAEWDEEIIEVRENRNYTVVSVLKDVKDCEENQQSWIVTQEKAEGEKEKETEPMEQTAVPNETLPQMNPEQETEHQEIGNGNGIIDAEKDESQDSQTGVPDEPIADSQTPEEQQEELVRLPNIDAEIPVVMPQEADADDGEVGKSGKEVPSLNP